jgi:hypothetical protein
MSGVDPLFALDRAARQGRVEDGDLVLLIVAGTGYTDPPRRRVMTWDDCETTVAAALRRTGMKEPEVDWRRGSAVGVASAEFSTRRPAGELDAVGYRMVDTDQPVAGQPHRRDPATGCDALRASPSQGGGSVGVVGSRQLPGQLEVCGAPPDGIRQPGDLPGGDGRDDDVEPEPDEPGRDEQPGQGDEPRAVPGATPINNSGRLTSICGSAREHLGLAPQPNCRFRSGCLGRLSTLVARVMCSSPRTGAGLYSITVTFEDPLEILNELLLASRRVPLH